MKIWYMEEISLSWTTLI